MKKITSLFAVLAMLATFVVMPVSAATGYAGGDGLTAETAYEIATAEQLAYAASKVNDGTDNTKYFKLTADIDYNEQEWIPIGASTNYFQGNFDGQGHVVKNLKITESCAYVGFFGCISTGGVVKNLGIDNMNINPSTGNNPNGVGGFASYVQGATITNCYLKNSIVRCGSKQASNGIGIFAGIVRNSSMIKNCYAYNIETLAHVNNVNAGFAHQRLGGGSTFENCYVAEVNSIYDRQMYSFGSDNLSNVTAVNCWSTLAAKTGANYNADYAFGNYVETKDELATKFKNVEGWAVSTKVNDAYPCFVSELPVQLYAGGDGLTAETAYEIANATHLANASKQINAGVDNKAYFKLTADIDYGNAEWVPMGSSPNYFQGNFDGQGHVVKNLKITESCAYVGFFGYINTGGVVKNLGIDNMNLNLSTGNNPDTVGGFASYVQGATITNCYLKNSIVRSAGKQASNGIGVFAGVVRNSSMIKNCYAYKIETLAHLNNVNAGFAHQRIGGGSTFENCYVAEINALWSRPAYSFGSDNQSNVNSVNCWSTLAAIPGGNYNAGYAFGNCVETKAELVSKFENVTGFAVSPLVNGGYPCFANEVPFKVTSVGGDGTVKIARKAGVTTPATVYVATYDGQGRMVDVKASAVNEDDFTFTPDGLVLSTTLKVFVWDANNNPIANMYTN